MSVLLALMVASLAQPVLSPLDSIIVEIGAYVRSAGEGEDFEGDEVAHVDFDLGACVELSHDAPACQVAACVDERTGPVGGLSEREAVALCTSLAER